MRGHQDAHAGKALCESIVLNEVNKPRGALSPIECSNYLDACLAANFLRFK